MSFQYDYESLVSAIAMIDAAVESLDRQTTPDAFGVWIDEMNTIRNSMNDARLAYLKPFGAGIYHLHDIPQPPEVTP